VSLFEVLVLVGLFTICGLLYALAKGLDAIENLLKRIANQRD